MQPQSSQQKGKRLENYINQCIEEMGLGRAIRTPGSGAGKIKGDSFNNLDFLLECKNEKQWHWDNIDQAIREAQQSNYFKDKWALIVKDPRYPEFERVYAVIDLGQFLELLKKNKEPIVKDPDRQTNWDIKNLIQSAKRVIKDLDV